MNDYLSRLAAGLEPYTPGEQPLEGGYIKLNTNENPYPPSPKVIEAIKENACDTLRLYPDPESRELCEAAAAYHKISPGMVFAGNGSDEVLAFAFAAFYSGKDIVFPEVTYSFYPVYCRLFGVGYREIPMGSGLSVDTRAMENAGCGVVTANPNAPTGELLDLETIEKIAAKNSGSVVLVDEAYIDFGGNSAVCLLNDHENLLVVQTFSKSRSLAGMRIGFAFGNEVLVGGLRRVRDSFNSYPLDRLSQKAGTAAFADDAYYMEIRRRIMKTREWSVKRLGSLGFNSLRTSSNFIFTSHPHIDAGEIYLKLKERKVLVRYFARRPTDGYIRITVGTDDQMDALFNELEKITSGC